MKKLLARLKRFFFPPAGSPRWLRCPALRSAGCLDPDRADCCRLWLGIHQLTQVLRGDLPHNAARIFGIPGFAARPGGLRGLPHR